MTWRMSTDRKKIFGQNIHPTKDNAEVSVWDIHSRTKKSFSLTIRIEMNDFKEG